MHFQVEVASHCEELLNIKEKEHKRGKKQYEKENRGVAKTEGQKDVDRKMSIIVKSARGECHFRVCLGIMSEEHT